MVTSRRYPSPIGSQHNEQRDCDLGDLPFTRTNFMAASDFLCRYPAGPLVRHRNGCVSDGNHKISLYPTTSLGYCSFQIF